MQWIVQWLWLWVETVSMLHPSRIEVYYASTIQCRLEQDLVRFFWAFRRFRRVLSRFSDFFSILSFTLLAHRITSRFWFAQFYEMLSQKESSCCKFTASPAVLQHAWAGRLGHDRYSCPHQHDIDCITSLIEGAESKFFSLISPVETFHPNSCSRCSETLKLYLLVESKLDLWI